MTVAWEIKYPWYLHRPWPKKARNDPNPFRLKRKWEEMSEAQQTGRDRHWPEGYRETFITIWHVDPELDGSDDSCGYSYVKLTKKQVEILRNSAWHEGQHPHFLCCQEKEWSGTFSESEALSRGLVFLVCRVLRLKITFEQAAKYASENTHILDCGKFGGQFCFLPGYHSNSKKDSSDDRQDYFHGVLCGVARNILTDRRPWWKHPRYHFWHWKIQCRLWQRIYRYFFERCAVCGKRFSKWGDSNVIGNWEGTKVWHGDCDKELRPK